MKALLVLIFTGAIGYMAYEYEPQIGAWLGVNMKPTPVQEPVVAAAPHVDVKVKAKPAAPAEPAPEPKPEPKPEMPTPAPAPPPVPTGPKPGEFVAPTFPTIEERTNNWAVLPASMFPRQIKATRAIELKGKVGGTTIPVGNPVYALKQEGADVIVAPAPDSPFQGKLGIDECDIKAVITGIYNGWVAQQVAAAKAKFDQSKVDAKKPKVAAVAVVKGDPKPDKDKDGSFPWLLASMKAGEVTEIKADNIKAWGEAKRQKIDKADVWVVDVTFEATTPFGKFETVAVAHVKDGKVMKWLYRDTGEVVP